MSICLSPAIAIYHLMSICLAVLRVLVLSRFRPTIYEEPSLREALKDLLFELLINGYPQRAILIYMPVTERRHLGVVCGVY